MLSGPDFRSPSTYQQFGIELRQGSGPEIACRCPRCESTRRHKRRTPLSVNIEKGVWRCNHCGETGSVVSGWKNDNVETRRMLQERYLPPRPLKPSAPKAVEVEMAAVENRRHIPREFLEEHGVVVADYWCRDCEDTVPQLAFPYFKHQKHVHTKYRHTAANGDKHFITDSQTDRCLYGYDVVLGDYATKPIILVEGEYDALAVRFADENYAWRVASVPDGGGAIDSAARAQEKRGEAVDVSKVNLPWLNDDALVRALLAAPYVVLALDADSVGGRLENELARRIGFANCRRVTWPTGCKDAGDVLVQLGTSGIQESIDAARPYPVEGLIRLADVEDRIDRLYEHGMPEGLSMGWSNLDPFLQLLRGQFIVAVGTTGSGKTHWVNQLALNVSPTWSTAICSPESGTVDAHAIRLLEAHTGRPFDRRKHPGIAMTAEELHDAKRWLDDRFTFVLPRDRSVKTVIDRMRFASIQRGAEFFVIDNWMSLRHEDTRDKLEYIERMLNDLQEFWTATSSTGVLVVHTAKPPGGKVVEMGLYAAAHSAGFANRADAEVEIIRERGIPGFTRIAVQKVRSPYVGIEGGALLTFDRKSGRYAVPTETDISTYNDLVDSAKGIKRAKKADSPAAGMKVPDPAEYSEPVPVQEALGDLSRPWRGSGVA